jgi:hypothetical protein
MKQRSFGEAFKKAVVRQETTASPGGKMELSAVVMMYGVFLTTEEHHVSSEGVRAPHGAIPRFEAGSRWPQDHQMSRLNSPLEDARMSMLNVIQNDLSGTIRIQ